MHSKMASQYGLLAKAGVVVGKVPTDLQEGVKWIIEIEQELFQT